MAAAWMCNLLRGEPLWCQVYMLCARHRIVFNGTCKPKLYTNKAQIWLQAKLFSRHFPFFLHYPSLSLTFSFFSFSLTSFFLFSCLPLFPLMPPLSAPSLLFSVFLYILTHTHTPSRFPVSHVSNLSSSSLHFPALLPFSLSLSASHSWHLSLALYQSVWVFVLWPFLLRWHLPRDQEAAGRVTTPHCFFSDVEFNARHYCCDIGLTWSLNFPQIVVTFRSECLTEPCPQMVSSNRAG